MELDRKDLKIEALRQRVSEITTNFEDRVADLRIELTIQNDIINSQNAEIERLQALVPQDGEAGEDSDSVE